MLYVSTQQRFCKGFLKNMTFQLILYLSHNNASQLKYLKFVYRPDTTSNQLGEISTNYKESFAQCLEPITATLVPHATVSLTGTGGAHTTSQQTSNNSSLVEAASSSSSKGGGGTFNSARAAHHYKRSTSSGAQPHFQSRPQRYQLYLRIT